MPLAIVLKLLKGSLEFVLTCLGLLIYYLGLAGLVIGMRPGALRVLMYHACEETETDFIRGLKINTTPADFAAQISFLQKHYQIVPLSALGRLSMPDRALVITFDDGLRSIREHAFPLLKLRQLPATCFLTTDVIGNRTLIWLNELCWFLNRHPAIARPIVSQQLGLGKRSSRNRLIEDLIARYDREKIDALLGKLRDATGTSPENLARTARLYLDRVEIEEMAQSGFTFGNHTGSHAVLSRLGDADCRGEIDRAARVLETLPESVPALAYPFGRSSAAVSRAALELGCTTLMEVEGNNNPVDVHHVGRSNVTSMTPAVLFAQIELVAPIKYRLKRAFTRPP
jgi:peptidoglycan/xylan/chitin deacetylase (PgdA/CDA1 family)